MSPAEAVPIGGIVAFAGDVTAPEIAAWLQTQGWLPCDGRSLPKQGTYHALSHVIEMNYGGSGGGEGQFNLPDLRGAFARGANHGLTPARDVDANARVAAAPGGKTGDAVGSSQTAATGPPRTPFYTDMAGDHAHEVPHVPINSNAYALVGTHYAIWTTESGVSGSSGIHTHALRGGDAETRPVNVYVNYIIKFSSGAGHDAANEERVHG